MNNTNMLNNAKIFILEFINILNSKTVIFLINIISTLILIIIANNLYTHNTIIEFITSSPLLGDENAFINTNQEIRDKSPITWWVIVKCLSFIFNNAQMSARIASLLFSLSAFSYILFNINRNYLIPTILILSFLLLHYPILYMATEDSAAIFFSIVGAHQIIYRKSNHIGIIFLILSLLTKDVSAIFTLSLIIVQKTIPLKKIYLTNTQIITLVLITIICVFAPYGHIHKDKHSEQAARYSPGTSWFNVRSLSAIANYKGELKQHRLMPDEYEEFKVKYQITPPRNNFIFLFTEPIVFFYDKTDKIKKLLWPHRNFGLSLSFLFILLSANSINNKKLDSDDFMLYVFLTTYLLGVIASVAGFMERRWVFSLELLFILSLVDKKNKRDQSFNIENLKTMLFTLHLIVIFYMNRTLFNL